MEQRKKKPDIYQLLDIKPDSARLLLIILPPVYSLWLLAIGRRLLHNQNQSDKFFSFLAITLFIFNIVQLVAVPFIGRSIVIEHRNEFMLFLKVYYLVFLLTIIVLTRITVSYDRLQTPDKYYAITDLVDYIYRFFAFLYWPLGIWFYQKTVNTYNKDLPNPLR